MPDSKSPAAANGEANGEFIAHARHDVPALLDEIEHLRAEVYDLKRCTAYDRATHKRCVLMKSDGHRTCRYE